MNYKISFEERTRLALENLSKQGPVTLEEARAQAQWLKLSSKSACKKTRPNI